MQDFDHVVSYIKGKEKKVAKALPRKNTDFCKLFTDIIKVVQPFNNQNNCLNV